MDTKSRYWSIGALMLLCLLAGFYWRQFRKQNAVGTVSELLGSTIVYHQRQEESALERAVVVIGDSHVRSLYVPAVSCRAINFGIGGDTTQGVLKRIPQYSSITTAGAVVLAIGVNDLISTSPAAVISNYGKILASIPAQVPVLVNALFPGSMSFPCVDCAGSIDQVNKGIHHLCSERAQCYFLNSGEQMVDGGVLADSYHAGDGVHLSPKANEIWIQQLRHALEIIDPSLLICG